MCIAKPTQKLRIWKAFRYKKYVFLITRKLEELLMRQKISVARSQHASGADLDGGIRG